MHSPWATRRTWTHTWRGLKLKSGRRGGKDLQESSVLSSSEFRGPLTSTEVHLNEESADERIEVTKVYHRNLYQGWWDRV